MSFLQKPFNQNLTEDTSIEQLASTIKSQYFFLKTKKKSILIATLIGGIVGIIISFIDKPQYESVLTFAMEEEKSTGPGLSGAIGLASSFGIDLGGAGGGGAFAASNLSELMKSRLIVEKVLLNPVNIHNKQISLIDYYIEVNGIKKKWGWRNREELQNLKFQVTVDKSKLTFLQDSVLREVHKILTDKDNLNIVQKDKKITILAIEVKSNDEFFSKVFCENIAKETSDFYIETKSKKAKTNVIVLQKQVDSVKLELNSAISGVAEEVDNVYNLNPAFNVKGAPSKKKQIDVQANTAILTNLVVQLELAKISLRKETPLIQIIDSPKFPLEKNKLNVYTTFILSAILFALLLSLFYLTRRFLKFE